MSASRHVSRSRPHPIRRPCGTGRANRARHPEPAAVFKRGDRSGDRPDRESHAIFACASDAREHAETHAAAARVRRAPGTASAGLLVEPWASGQLRVCEEPSSSNRRPRNCVRPRLVTGDDLIAAGYAPGPDFSRMLEVAEDAQLEARIHKQGGRPGTGAIHVRPPRQQRLSPRLTSTE